MKLVTKRLERLLEQNPIYSTDGEGEKAKVLIKFFNPVGKGTWLVTEGQREENDWLFYGKVKISEWEFGYFRLSELMNIRLPLGMTIERDCYLDENATLESES